MVDNYFDTDGEIINPYQENNVDTYLLQGTRVQFRVYTDGPAVKFSFRVNEAEPKSRFLAFVFGLVCGTVMCVLAMLMYSQNF